MCSAIKDSAVVARELGGATIGKDALTSPRDLDVKAVITSHVIADVVNLHNHCLPIQILMSTSPLAIRMNFASEVQLEALSTICVTR